MLRAKDYKIHFSNLKVGEHEFELVIDDAFFDHFTYSEIKQGDVKVNIKLLKRTNVVLLDIDFSGSVKTICDRCASELDLPIELSQKLTVKMGVRESNDDDTNDEVVYISSSDNSIDLKQHLYEYITIALPIKREHQLEADCDQEVISRLNHVVIEAAADDTNEEEIDPRWSELIKLKPNNKIK